MSVPARSLIHLCVAFLCCPPLVSAWAQFPMAGGNAQRTGYIEAPGPMSEPSIAWEHGLGVSGGSSTQPTLDEQGNIYLTGAPPGGKDASPDHRPNGAFVSLTPDGKERWRFNWAWDPTKPRFDGSASQLSGPVLCGDNHVAMGFRWGMFRCWNRNTGKLVWEKNLAPDLQSITCTPVVDGEGFVYLYIRNVPILHKLNPITGDIVWSHPFADGVEGNASSPSLSPDQQTVYILRTANNIGYLYAIDARSGALKWGWSPEVAAGHSFAWNIPIVDASGLIFVQDEEYSSLYAIKDLGKIHAFQWSYKPGGTQAPRLAAISPTHIFSYYAKPHPVVFCLDRSGKEIWTAALPTGEGIGGLIATPTAIYFGVDGTGKTYALNSATGEILWSKQVGHPEGDFSEGLTLAPDGTLYAGTDGTAEHPNQATVVALRAR